MDIYQIFDLPPPPPRSVFSTAPEAVRGRVPPLADAQGARDWVASWMFQHFPAGQITALQITSSLLAFLIVLNLVTIGYRLHSRKVWFVSLVNTPPNRNADDGRRRSLVRTLCSLDIILNPFEVIIGIGGAFALVAIALVWVVIQYSHQTLAKAYNGRGFMLWHWPIWVATPWYLCALCVILSAYYQNRHMSLAEHGPRRPSSALWNCPLAVDVACITVASILCLCPIPFAIVTSHVTTHQTAQGYDWLFKYQFATDLSQPMLAEAILIFNTGVRAIYWLSIAMILWAFLAFILSGVVMMLLARRLHRVWPAEIQRLRERTIRLHRLHSGHGTSVASSTLMYVPPPAPAAELAEESLASRGASLSDDALPFSNFVSFPAVDPAAMSPFHRAASLKERMRYLDGIYTTSVALNTAFFLIGFGLLAIAIYIAQGIYAAFEDIRIGEFLAPALLVALWASIATACVVLWLSLRPPLPVVRAGGGAGSIRSSHRAAAAGGKAADESAAHKSFIEMDEIARPGVGAGAARYFKSFRQPQSDSHSSVASTARGSDEPEGKAGDGPGTDARTKRKSSSSLMLLGAKSRARAGSRAAGEIDAAIRNGDSIAHAGTKGNRDGVGIGELDVTMDEQDSLPMMRIEQSTVIVEETVDPERPPFAQLVHDAQERYHQQQRVKTMLSV